MPLGDAGNFTIIGSSTITNTGPFTIVNGNVALSPGSSITGFPPGTITGDIHINDTIAQNARADAFTAYNTLAGLTPTTNLTGMDLGGMILLSGVYHFDTSAGLGGLLTLDTLGDANAVFVFQIGTTLTTASASSVVVAGALNAPNIFWQVGSSATFGTTTTFAGNVLALASITMNTGASLTNGRLIALNGAVTLDDNANISAPAAPPAALGRYWNGADPVNGNLWTGDNWSSGVSIGDTIPLGANVDVFFSVVAPPLIPINQNTLLGADVTISSLTVNDSVAVTIGGPNTLTISSTGLITGINVNNGAGLVTISSGLELGNLSQVIDVNNDAGMLISGVVSGTNGLTKAGTGVLALTNANIYTGATVLSNGTLLVGNSLALSSGPLTISGGYIDTVASQPLQINVGNYDQTGGTLGIRLSGPGGAVNTFYSVTGTADINGGTVFLYDGNDIYDLDGYTPSEGDIQTIIDSTLGVTGTGFADNTPDSLIQGINYSQGNTLLYPTLNYDVLDSVYVLWVQAAFASILDLTPNQTAVANSIDAGDAPTAVTDFLITQNIAALPGLYDLIAPDELTAIYQMGFAAAEIQNANIKRHLERVRQGSSRETQYTETTTDSKGGMVQQQSTMMSDSKRWTAFFEGTDGSATIEGDYNSSGYDFDTRGGNLGADYRVSDRLSVGIMGSYADSTASLVNGGSIEAESFKGAIYATIYDEEFYVDALLGAGQHSYDTRRVGLLGLAEGSTDALEIDAMLNTGYDIKNGNWTYGPMASVAYTRMMMDSFTETGSLAPLHFPSQHQDSLRSELGAKIAYNADVNGMRITPQVRLAWQHEFLDSKQAMESSFVGGTGSTFTVHGPDMDRDRAVLSAGLTVQITPNVCVYGFYDGHVGSSDYKSNQVTAGIKFDF